MRLSRTKPEMSASSSSSDWPRNGTLLKGWYVLTPGTHAAQVAQNYARLVLRTSTLWRLVRLLTRLSAQAKPCIRRGILSRTRVRCTVNSLEGSYGTAVLLKLALLLLLCLPVSEDSFEGE